MNSHLHKATLLDRTTEKEFFSRASFLLVVKSLLIFGWLSYRISEIFSYLWFEKSYPERCMDHFDRFILHVETQHTAFIYCIYLTVFL